MKWFRKILQKLPNIVFPLIYLSVVYRLKWELSMFLNVTTFNLVICGVVRLQQSACTNHSKAFVLSWSLQSDEGEYLTWVEDFCYLLATWVLMDETHLLLDSSAKFRPKKENMWTSVRMWPLVKAASTMFCCSTTALELWLNCRVIAS